MTTVLMILTASDHWTLKDGSRHPTGYWAEEFLAPYEVFTRAGWDVTVATPGGTPPTVDQTSLGLFGGLPPKTRRIKEALTELAPVLDAPVDLETVDHAAYDLVFYPGGHGPMEDLAYDKTSGRLLADRLAAGRPIAMLCHAPAAILAASDGRETSPFAGYRMTGLSNREEALNGLAGKAPWLLEDRLREAGVEYSRALLPLRPHIVVDRAVYTGQNPQSSRVLAERLVADLGSGS